MKILIPCYSEQNGYYSDNITIIVKDKTEYKICMRCEEKYE